MNVAELFVKCLEEEGVRYIFGVPGEENLDLLNAIEKSKIEFVLTHHETGAAFMAGLMGRLTGEPGVCLATLGPGATNLLTGVADANMNRSPVVAITAQAGMNRLHKESHQAYDIVSLYRPVTKWNTSIRKPEITPEIVHKAFEIARSEKPGATHIELPEDIAAMEVTGEPIVSEKKESILVQTLDETIQQAVTLIQQATKPLVLCGNGVTRDRAEKEVRQFIEKIKAPVTQTFMGKGALPQDHPQCLMSAGMPGRDYIDLAFEETDLIISIGLDIAEYRPDRWNRKKNPILHIDTLIAETDAHYPVQLSLIGDLSENIRKLNQNVISREKMDPFYEHLRNQMQKDFQMYQEDTSFPLKPQKILADLKSVMDPKDLLLSDVGAHKLWVGRLFPTDYPNTCLISNGLAAMGYALPGAIGAKLVHPDRNVVAIIGDGSFQMTGMELETALRLNLPMVILLWRDEGYGLIEWKQLDEFGHSTYVKFGNPDFVMLARSYGAEGFRIQRAEELVPTLEKALKLNKPVLIDCPVDYQENMKLTNRMNQIDIS